jgi:hypothetical protein
MTRHEYWRFTSVAYLNRFFAGDGFIGLLLIQFEILHGVADGHFPLLIFRVPSSSVMTLGAAVLSSYAFTYRSGRISRWESAEMHR